MDRAAGPKTSLLGRIKDRAAGTGFVAISDGIAVLHAVYILPDWRRMGLAGMDDSRRRILGARSWR